MDPHTLMDEFVSEKAISSDVDRKAPISMDFDFLSEVEAESGVKASACFQCGKCSNGWSPLLCRGREAFGHGLMTVGVSGNDRK